jgi:hypothetical protein
MALNKVLRLGWHVAHLQVASAAQLLGNIAWDILWPFFGGVEADHPDRVLVLPFEHVPDDRFEIGPLGVGFAISPTGSAEIIQDDVDVPIIVVRHDRG